MRWLATRSRRRLAATALALAVCARSPVRAQIAVSSNDNKAIWIDGVNVVPADPQPDTVTILDLSPTIPHVIAELNVPGGWSAPPQSVAVSPDASIALVASSARLDASDTRR